MSRARILTSALMALTLSLLGLLIATPAYAAWSAHFIAGWTYSGATPTALTQVTQRIRFTKKAEQTFLATSWRYVSSEPTTSGGYVGLQTNGHRFDGTIGDMAIFSIEGADAAVSAAPGATCKPVTGTSWSSCRSAMRISSTAWYEVQVTKGVSDEPTSTDKGGQWWSATLRDTATGAPVPLGAIRVPSEKQSLAGPRNYSQYFGPAVACDRVPASIADFQPPAGKAADGDVVVGTDAREVGRGTCTRGAVMQYSYSTGVVGARILLGGR